MFRSSSRHSRQQQVERLERALRAPDLDGFPEETVQQVRIARALHPSDVGAPSASSRARRRAHFMQLVEAKYAPAAPVAAAPCVSGPAQPVTVVHDERLGDLRMSDVERIDADRAAAVSRAIDAHLGQTLPRG